MAGFSITNGEGKVFSIETTKNGFEVPCENYPFVMDLTDDQIRKVKNWINKQLREKKKAAAQKQEEHWCPQCEHNADRRVNNDDTPRI